MNQFEVLEKETDGSEYLEFSRVENKRSLRPDLHAFLLLDEIFPSDQHIVAAAWHEKICLNISDEEIESISMEHALELTRCGVMYNAGIERLTMFV